ncbi:hypothetical protein B0H13DRAFT_2313431 [Mycena leptocephala]|nr:hypothetical protein B0H13DRAFT_2313431 [Mycena leptocephala]
MATHSSKSPLSSQQSSLHLWAIGLQSLTGVRDTNKALQASHPEDNAASTALTKLSEISEFQPAIRNVISQIVALQGYYGPHMKVVALPALSILSNQPEFQPAIGNAIPEIIALLKGGVGEAPTFHANVVHFENMNGPSAILAGTEAHILPWFAPKALFDDSDLHATVLLNPF